MLPVDNPIAPRVVMLSSTAVRDFLAPYATTPPERKCAECAAEMVPERLVTGRTKFVCPLGHGAEAAR